jgi:hypothetical protein
VCFIKGPRNQALPQDRTEKKKRYVVRGHLISCNKLSVWDRSCNMLLAKGALQIAHAPPDNPEKGYRGRSDKLKAKAPHVF